MKFVTEDQIEYFRQRYPHAPESTLQYALKSADDYADLHASDMLQTLRNAVAQLHLRHAMQPDPGERVLIRRLIDDVLKMGRAINACAEA